MGHINKSFLDFVNEMNTDSYAKIMNKTSNYPWHNTLDSSDSDKGKSKKEEKVNKLSKIRFEQEFYKEYPKETTKISTNLGDYVFIGLKYKTNSNRYDLGFMKKHGMGMHDYIWVSDDNGEIYSDNSKVKIEEKSNALLNQMLKYNDSRLNKDIANESRNNKKAIVEYGKTLSSEILTKAKGVAKMLNLDLREGDIYTKSQYPDYTNFKEYKDKLESYIDELDIYDFYYCYETDEILTSEPSGEDAEGFQWTLIDKDEIIKELFGEIAEYL